ncbi:MAG: PHB depolymerase family esterase [Bdellovibrionales bacterium]|nr:PHB depolymerase family esterase [Bdellovibrionales bacterium]
MKACCFWIALFCCVSGTARHSVYHSSGGTIAYYSVIPAAPKALVVALHGCKLTPTDFESGTRLSAWARRENFGVVYPEQPETRNPLRCWNWFLPANQGRSGEAARIAALTRYLARKYSLSRDHLYVVGISAGGAMTAILAACYSDLFASAAIHSAPGFMAAKDAVSAGKVLEQGNGKSEQEMAALVRQCRGRRRDIPVLVIHGSDDTRVVLSVGKQAAGQFRVANGLADMVTATEVCSEAGRSCSLDWYGSQNVGWMLVSGLGHAWSGGGSAPYSDPAGPDVTRKILEFWGLLAVHGSGR